MMKFFYYASIMVLSPLALSAHEQGQKIPIDCSTEVISSPVLENGAMVYKDQRRTNFSIPLNAVSNHFTIPKNTGISFRLPVVAVGDGDFPFRHSVTIPIQSEEGVLSIVDTFGVPWYSVTEEEKFGEVLSLECYIVF